jgi:hypothetical protein
MERKRVLEWLERQLAKLPPLTPERWAKIAAVITSRRG